jgi:DivIVA domain-containing protein
MCPDLPHGQAATRREGHVSLTGADVRAARFAATKFRDGYNQDDVDTILDRAAAALDDIAAHRATHLTLTAEQLLNAKFRATKFREGYDQDAVDTFLATVVQELRRTR